MRRFVSYPILEALANARSTKLQILVQLLLAIVVGVAVISLTALNCKSLVSEWTKQEVAGRSTYVVTATSSSVPAALCDQANRIDGVRGSGAILQRYSVTTSLGSASTVDVVRVTPGYLLAAWSERTPPVWRVAAPIDLAQRFGLANGSSFLTTPSTVPGSAASVVTVDWVASQRSRVAGINDAVIEAAPALGKVSECLVSAEPSHRDAVGSALKSWFGKEYRVAPYLPPSALIVNPDAAFAARPSQWIAVAAPFFLVTFQSILLFARRGDFALYRALGMTDRAVMQMVLTEFVVALFVPFQIGASLGLVAAVGLETEGMVAVVNDYARALCVLTIGAYAGVLLISRGVTLDRIRGR